MQNESLLEQVGPERKKKVISIFSRMTESLGAGIAKSEDHEWERTFRKQPEIFRKWEACGGSSPF